jgi:hypothetical protein
MVEQEVGEMDVRPFRSLSLVCTTNPSEQWMHHYYGTSRKEEPTYLNCKGLKVCKERTILLCELGCYGISQNFR